MQNKLWNFKYCSIIGINILICFSFYMITTILMVYLVGIGASLSSAGMIVGLFSITSLVIRPVIGYITDRFNRKVLLMIGSFMVGISILAYVLTINFPAIIIFRIIHGFAFGINSTAIVAIASEYIPIEKFNEGIGYLGIGQIIASAVGPGLGVAMMNRFGIEYAFYIAAAFSFLAVICLVFFPYPKKGNKGKKYKLSLQNIISINVLDYAFIAGVYSFMNGVITTFIVLYAKEKGISDVGVYFAVSAVCLLIVRPLAGKLVDKKGLAYVVYPGMILTIISIMVLVSANSLLMILVSAVLRAFAQGAIQPSLQAASIRKVGIEKSGVATSTYYLGGDIGQGAGPMLGGIIVGVYGYKWLFSTCGALVIVASVVFYLNYKKSKEVVK